jgi:hypothetical protein
MCTKNLYLFFIKKKSVHDPADPYRKDYDFEYVITMSDWYHQVIQDMLRIRMSPGYAGGNVRIKSFSFFLKNTFIIQYNQYFTFRILAYSGFWSHKWCWPL